MQVYPQGSLPAGIKWEKVAILQITESNGGELHEEGQEKIRTPNSGGTV